MVGQQAIVDCTEHYYEIKKQQQFCPALIQMSLEVIREGDWCGLHPVTREKAVWVQDSSCTTAALSTPCPGMVSSTVGGNWKGTLGPVMQQMQHSLLQTPWESPRAQGQVDDISQGCLNTIATGFD